MSWMKELDGNVKVLQYNIPGTHDCVTQYVQLPHISRCQNMSIYEQLDLGIRALDIRVMFKGERLVMIHGIAKAFNTPNKKGGQMDLEDVLSQCYRFLGENPTETIIFQFKNDIGKFHKNNMKSFDNLFRTYIKGNEDRWFLENRIPKLDEARGKIVLIRRCWCYGRAEYTPNNTGIDFSRWFEQDVAVPEPLTLYTSGVYDDKREEFIIQDRFKYKPEERWRECILPFLETMGPFRGTYVIDYLSTAGGFKGPEENAKYINAKFMEYELKKGYYYGTIYCDFPTKELVDKIVNSNF